METISTALKRLLLKIRRWSSTFLKMLNCYFKTAWCGFVLCLQSLNSNTEPASFLLHFVSFHHDFIRSQQTAGWLSLEQICTLLWLMLIPQRKSVWVTPDSGKSGSRHWTSMFRPSKTCSVWKKLHHWENMVVDLVRKRKTQVLFLKFWVSVFKYYKL